MSNIGGFVMGKPDARTSLVEYISYTCSHCAEFTQKAAAPLKINWISTGAINVEIRNAVRDRYDLTAALLARCGGARSDERRVGQEGVSTGRSRWAPNH